MELNIFLTMGIVGMALILIAFLLNQMNIWKQEMLVYDFTNFAGSLLLVIYAWEAAAWPFVILNAVWAVYSLKDVVTTMIKR